MTRRRRVAARPARRREHQARGARRAADPSRPFRVIYEPMDFMYISPNLYGQGSWAELEDGINLVPNIDRSVNPWWQSR